MPGHDRKDWTVGKGELGTGGQMSWGLGDGAEQLGQDSRDTIARAGQPGQDSCYRTAREDSRDS
jgi:hypothetical protein